MTRLPRSGSRSERGVLPRRSKASPRRCAKMALFASESSMAQQPSAGARFRAALAAEQPLQVIGAINANHALLAKRAGLPCHLPVRRRCRGGFSGPAGPGHQHARRRAHRCPPHHRRVRPAADGRHRYRLRAERVQHRPHGEKPGQVRRRRLPHRGPGRRQALRSPAGQGNRHHRGNGRSRQGRGRRQDRSGLLPDRAHRRDRRGRRGRRHRACHRLRRGGCRRDLRRGRLRPADATSVSSMR